VAESSLRAFEDHMRAVNDLLGELGLSDRPTILAMNKVDRLETDPAVLAARSDAIAIAAVDGTGIDTLLAAIEHALPPVGTLTLKIPHGEGASLALCYERGRVLARRDTPGHVELDVDLPIGLLGALARYRVTGSEPAAGVVD